MSDDRRDDDSGSGGLWDPDAPMPDALTAARPALRVVDSAALATGTAEKFDEEPSERLVRLDQFRDRALQEATVATRRRAVVGAATVALAAAAVMIAVIGLGRGGERSESPAAQTGSPAGTEQAAIGRVVHPAGKTPPAKHRSHRKTTGSRRRANVSRSAKRFATNPQVPTVRTSAPSTSGGTTPRKSKPKAEVYNVASSGSTPVLEQPVAASEFGIER